MPMGQNEVTKSGQEELQISVVYNQNEQGSHTMQDCNMSSIWGFLPRTEGSH